MGAVGGGGGVRSCVCEWVDGWVDGWMDGWMGGCGCVRQVKSSPVKKR